MPLTPIKASSIPSPGVPKNLSAQPLKACSVAKGVLKLDPELFASPPKTSYPANRFTLKLVCW